MFQAETKLTNLVSHSRALSDLLIGFWNIPYKLTGSREQVKLWESTVNKGRSSVMLIYKDTVTFYRLLSTGRTAVGI